MSVIACLPWRRALVHLQSAACGGVERANRAGAAMNGPAGRPFFVHFVDASSGPGSRVAGMPEVGPLGVDPGSGRSLTHTQAGVLIRTQKAPELEVLVAR